MLISRGEVEKILAVALSNINSKLRAKEKFTDKLKERGFATGEAMTILSGHNPLIQITDDLIYLLVMICYDIVQESSLKFKLTPERSLTEKEIEIAKSIMVERKNDSIYPITIENVNFDMDDDYSTVFTIEMLSKYFDNRLIKYNAETQRPLMSKWYNNQEVKEVFINDKNRKAIEKNIIEGKQVPNYITLNILANGEDDFTYNSEKRTLTINSGDINLLDGFHRTLAARNVFCKNPSVKFNFKIRIVHWELEKAMAFIHQESLGTQLDPLARKSYDVYNEVNQVVNKLNENPKSILRNKITTDISNILNSKALVMFDVVFDSIDQLFKVKNSKDVITVGNHIRSVLNLIADNNIDIVENPIDPKTFATYMVIASECYGREDWEDYVIETLERIDLSQIETFEFKKINKPLMKHIKNYILESEV